MGNIYQYFERDISWLSFNYRVLLEAEDEQLPLYERINFISIYSSNLEEFYKVRVADHRAIASGKTKSDDETVQSAQDLVRQINKEVNLQLEDRIRIYEQQIIPALREKHIIFYQDTKVEPFHTSYIKSYFREELFPFLQPVPIAKDEIVYFLYDKFQYLAVKLISKQNRSLHYFVIRLPHERISRFVELPRKGDNYYLMYSEDIIKANLSSVFPGYEIESSYSFKTSRDADIYINEEDTKTDIVEQVKKKIKKRKIGAVCRFVYDQNMPEDFLHILMETFHIHADELVHGDKHLNLEDLRLLPNPIGPELTVRCPKPIHLKIIDKGESIFHYVEKKDLLLFYPYHSFSHFIRFLYEAVHDPNTKEIFATQYRVAENSAVINTLIAAAQNGKEVTIFVELKARFDEERNLATAEMMEAAGIRIIYSLPKLKVHAKVTLIRRKKTKDTNIPDLAYISTGNFNEKTAELYADCGLFTCNKSITDELYNLFKLLQGEKVPAFHTLLITRHNLIPELENLISREIELADQGKTGRIILKMNALQDSAMIDWLYKASEHGVKIDLIIRGINCLIPNQSYSKNIYVTRIVDSFLEHARIWYFGNDGQPMLYLGSPDWMKRNLYRRIETVTPVFDTDLKKMLIDILQIQLSDNQKACFIDENLKNQFKKPHAEEKRIRAQDELYRYLR